METLTASSIKRQKAIEFVAIYKNSKRVTKKSIAIELNKVNRIIKKELTYSKHLRNLSLLNDYLLLRTYYKTIINLI